MEEWAPLEQWQEWAHSGLPPRDEEVMGLRLQSSFPSHYLCCCLPYMEESALYNAILGVITGGSWLQAMGNSSKPASLCGSNPGEHMRVVIQVPA